MPAQKDYRIPKAISDALESLPLTKSSSARLAIMGAAQRPELLPMALRVRAYKSKCPDQVKIAIKDDPSVVEALKGLAEAYDLSIQEALRLSLEAYIYKL